ncbi:MAG: dihydropteroate synthase [Pseudohongiellaceae bacterium]|jgi:dihydropteroate synthase
MTILIAGARQISLSAPVCMAIVNVTPDSFSDGAQFSADSTATTFKPDLPKILAAIESMVKEGATFIDIGGESTRPGATLVGEAEELDRVIPVVEAVRANLDVCISVDTSSPGVMRAAVNAGAEMINDVRALSRPGALEAAAQTNAAICVMHMQGQPGSMQEVVAYDNVVDEVTQFLQQRLHACMDLGIARTRLLADPGFGFGKKAEHNFMLLKNLSQLAVLQVPLLVGVSRKSMLGVVTGRSVDQRLAASIAAIMPAMAAGAKVIRAHDVAATMDAIRVHCAYQNPEQAAAHD